MSFIGCIARKGCVYEPKGPPPQDDNASVGTLSANPAQRSMEHGFVHDQLASSSKLRLLTVINVFTREALAIEGGPKLRGEHVATVLNRLIYLRGAPNAVFCDNGAEFTRQIIDLWAYTHKVRLDFSRPGTPTDNAHIESFNGTLRDEFLNVN